MTTAVRRAPTRGTEATGARRRTQLEVTDSASEPVTPDLSAFALTGELGEVAAATLARARDHLLGLQDPRGW